MTQDKHARTCSICQYNFSPVDLIPLVLAPVKIEGMRMLCTAGNTACLTCILTACGNEPDVDLCRVQRSIVEKYVTGLKAFREAATKLTPEEAFARWDDAVGNLMCFGFPATPGCSDTRENALGILRGMKHALDTFNITDPPFANEAHNALWEKCVIDLHGDGQWALVLKKLVAQLDKKEEAA